MVSRRTLLQAGGLGLVAAGCFPRLAYAQAPTEQRFVFIIQRGAADGLHTVPPLGDPAYAGLRKGLAQSLDGATRIDSTFSLHPGFKRLSGLFAERQALAVHAVASVYRDRSHFDGQNILESGGTRAYEERSGWMNRLISLLPASDSRALALTQGIPMALRGNASVSSYAPAGRQFGDDDLLQRVSGLYTGDNQLSGIWNAALTTRGLVGEVNQGQGKSASGSAAKLGSMAGHLLAAKDGARIMMIESLGWDTHTVQAGKLNKHVAQLDIVLGALVDGLGDLWRNTLVIVATEFGRTAAINGTNGTDHGTGSAMLVAGGAIQGGRVISDWPGLAPAALYEGRDLKPTMATEAAICGFVAQHYGLEFARVAKALYPMQPGIAAASGAPFV